MSGDGEIRLARELLVVEAERDKLKQKLRECAEFLRDDCVCERLADPKDRSRYANYEKHSGNCTRCKLAEGIENLT